MQDCYFDGRQPNQKEEGWKEGRSLRLIII
jgi:hypothetical protein